MSDLCLEDLDKILFAQKGRIIHQIWFGLIPTKREAKKVYEKMKIYRDSWKIKNPTWFHIEWNKPMCIQFVHLFYPEHTALFKNYKYEIQRCDAIRYLLLHRYGGWYVDMDYFCNRPLDEAHASFPGDIFLVQTPNAFINEEKDYVSNSLMYSTPQNAFWKQIMVELEKNQNPSLFMSKHLVVMFTTGPGIVNRVYSRYKYKYKVKSLPYKLFQPFTVNDMKTTKLDPDVFAMHAAKSTWAGKDTEFFNMIMREWKILALILCLFLIPIFYWILRRIK